MKILAINGSPRINWNDAILLKAALSYAEEEGHETELVHLSKLNFRGCRSCLVCKLDKEPWRSNTDCAIKDDLNAVLDKSREADIILIASPIYFGSLTADTYAYIERLLFPPMHYASERPSNWKKKVKSGLILTMNVPDPGYYKNLIDSIKTNFSYSIGEPEVLAVGDTCQFDDYSKYICTIFDHKHKESRKITEASEEYKRARELMKKLIL